MILGNVRDTPSVFETVENDVGGMEENVTTKIGRGRVYKLLNGDLTEAGLIKKTKGFSTLGSGLDSAIIRNLEFFKSAASVNVEQLLAVSNGKLWHKTSAGSWTSFKSGLTDEYTGITVANFKAFFHQNSENVRYWDGSSLTETFANTNTDPPRAKYGLWALGWLLLANDAGSDSATRGSDHIYYGTNGDPTTGWNRTTKVLKIGQGEGGDIVGLLPWTDFDFLVLKTTRIFKVTINSTDPANWSVNALTADIGCLAGAAVTMGDLCLFLAEDGIRSIHITDNNIKLTERAPLSQGRIDTTFARVKQSTAATTAVATHWNGVARFSVPFDAATKNNGFIEYNTRNDAFSYREDLNIGRFAKARYAGVTTFHGSDSTSGTGAVYKFEDTFNYNGTAIAHEVELRGMDFGLPAVWKIGGEVEFVFNATGDYDVTVQARVDQGGYQTIGTINLAGSGPNLPVNLPFYLGESVVRSKLSLASLGRFREIQFKYLNEETGSEIEFIRMIARSLPQEYSKVR